jgi:hypothetical protein
VSNTDKTPDLVTDSAQLAAVCDEVSDEEFYAIDTEFHTERRYWPKLALIQLGWSNKVALIDPLAVDPAPLSRLFAGSGTAVAHCPWPVSSPRFWPPDVRTPRGDVQL